MVLSAIGSEFWLISAKIPNPNENMEQLGKKIADLGIVSEFKIPSFKVGTLDTLIGLSDDLSRHDIFVENLLRKICNVIAEMMENRIDKILETLVIDPSVDGRMDDYVKGFHWDLARYQIKQPLRTLVDVIVKHVVQIEKDQKSKTSHFFNVKNMLALEERKISGSLVNRALHDLVNKDDFVLNSEYLVTLLVVVRKCDVDAWWSNYNKLCEMVVPKSSKIIYEDNENCLVNVTLFRKDVADFKENSKQFRFIVRDFEYNEVEVNDQKRKYAKLLAEKDKTQGILIKWLKVNFSETFLAWIHLKAVRVFVESVLRYGLPVEFNCVVIKTEGKNNKRLKEIVDEHYNRLITGVSGADNKDNGNHFINELRERENTHDLEKIMGSQHEIKPYIYFPIKTTFLD